MYKLLLTSRYLRRKLTPLFPLVTVVLCVAMVIIVISIMGGFLDLVKNAGRTLMGDVSVSTGVEGFPHYREMIKAIEDLPEAEAATPIIRSFGLLKLPFGIVKTVAVTGIDGEGAARVTRYRDTLYWSESRLKDPRYDQVKELYQGHDPVESAIKMVPPWKVAVDQKIPAIVPGIEVSPGNRRTSDGSYVFAPAIIGLPLTLTVVPITREGGLLEPSTTRFVAINEFNSGVFDVDDKTVFIPFDVAQDMLKMTGGARVMRDAQGNIVFDEQGNPKTEGVEPARASEVHVRAAPGVSADQLRQAVDVALIQFSAKHPNLPALYAVTWQERQQQFLDAVQNEKNLMTFLFGIISLVAVLMIAVVFYMIVLEKTRDIGILRAIGAAPGGVASIFLSFGLVIGTLGAALGVTVAYLIVNNINEIHTWLGNGFGATAFIVGVPFAAAVLYAAVAAVHALVEAIFDRRRIGTAGTLAIGGFVVGLALAAVEVFLAGGILSRGLTAGNIGSQLAMIFGAGLAMALIVLIIDATYWLIDHFTAGRRQLNVLIMAMLGGGLALIGVGAAFLVTDGLAEHLNTAMGFQIWDRKVYFFARIPSQLNWTEVGVIAAVAIVSSVLGALVPSLRAALLDPVETLRYE